MTAPTGGLSEAQHHPLRVIVCGGRDFKNYEVGFSVLDQIDQEHAYISMIVHGNASGADTIASAWVHCNKRQEWPFPAEWSKYGKSAGPRRNKQMLGSGATLVIAFPGGKGTRNMVKQALAAGLQVIDVAPMIPAGRRAVAEKDSSPAKEI